MQYRYLDLVFKELYFSEINWTFSVPTKINFEWGTKNRADRQSLPKVENKQVKQVNTLYSKRGIGRKSITLLKIFNV